MLYIISGTSRSGKTIIAKELMRKTGIPYMSLDVLVMGFTNGIPEYGIHDKLWPNEIAKKMWPFLRAMCESMLWLGDDYILEGEAVLPKDIATLTEKYPDKVRVIYVGYTEISAEEKIKYVKQFSTGKNDWLTQESDEYIRDHLKNMIQYSKMIKAECSKYDLPYFDTSNNFSEVLKTAKATLINQG